MELKEKFNKTQKSKRSRKITQKLLRKLLKELLKSPIKLLKLQEKLENTLNQSNLASPRLKALSIRSRKPLEILLTLLKMSKTRSLDSLQMLGKLFKVYMTEPISIMK